LGIVIAALITVVSFMVSIKLGVIAVIALLIIARIIRGPSKSGGIIGVEHADLPIGRTYGGGFVPGGLLGVSGLGAHFGVYGAPVAERKGPRKEYYEVEKREELSKKQRAELAAAITEAEARTGHQILAVIGTLDEDHAAKADRVAAEWPTASIVVCIDLSRNLYELRWRDASFELDAAHIATFAEMARLADFTAAIALLAEVLPVQTAVAELPDIIED
jgi:hypothetical protein